MVATKLPLLAVAAALLLLLHAAAAAAAGMGKPRKPHRPRKAGFPQQFLVPHNKARAAVGLKPLVWDPTLAAFAKSYAAQRQLDCALVHSTGAYGENIFWGSGKGWTPAQVVVRWVVERRYYNYYGNSCAGGCDCGHYTQIVWRDTARLGCAMVNCAAGKGVFAICEYDPPGNYVGEKPY